MEESKKIQEQKKAEQKKIQKENSEKTKIENEKKTKMKESEIAARKEKKENKENREKSNSFKKRLLSMGLMEERHIDTIIEALLQDNEILESFIDKASAKELRKKAHYGTNK